MPKPENVAPHKFKKGQSGNPKGRPVGALSRSTVARHWLSAQETIKNPITGQTERLSEEDIMTLALIKKARGGDVNAYRALLDSAYGAPKQETENENRNTIRIEWDE